MRTTLTPAGAEILAAVQQVRPSVEAAAPKAAADRRLPAALVAELKATGIFRMPMPASWGGPELPMTDQLAVLEELTYADGAAGWCAMIGCDSGFYGQFFDDDVARSIWDDLDLITAGQTQPVGRAVADGDGWLVSGRWSFGSGCTHADRIVGGAFLHDADGAMRLDALGLPEWRTFVLPIAEVVLHDNWDPTGLAGTGSHDYSAESVWVPDEHGFEPLKPGRRTGPLYSLPWWFIVKLAAVPLGLARRAIDELIALAPAKLVVPEFAMLADVPHAQASVARARAAVSSARSWLYDVVAESWDELERTGELGAAGRADLRLAMTHATTAGRDAVALCFDAATTASIKRGSPIDRAHRDLATVAQHIVVNQRTYGHIGQVLLGGNPAVPML